MYDIRRLQLEQLAILDELKRVCEEENLKFYLSCGTCIGAVRHHGCIPWDDDIDVFMYVEEFDKLMKCASKFNDGFFLQTQDTDPGYPGMIARVRKNNTACVEKDELMCHCHHGIFVDIYALYGYPRGFIKQKRLVFDSLLYRLLLAGRAPYNHGLFSKIVGNIVLGVLTENRRKQLLPVLKNRLRKYKNTEKLSILFGMDVSMRKIITYNQEWFQQPAWCEFENRIMPIPTNADAYLRERYGDYMQLPPKDKQKSYHTYAIVDFEKSYVN